jgi:sodium/potassium-transporting ATPase subunit alpha
LFFVAACCGKAVFDSTELKSTLDVSVDERKVNGDASEAGILKFCEKLQSVEVFRAQHPQVMTIPFNSTNKFMLTCNKVVHDQGHLRLCMKGAPERLLDRCSSILTRDGTRPLDADAKSIINKQLAMVMERGERALGFAMRNLEEEQYPETFEFNTDGQNFPMEGLKFVGIMALLDPPRESVP